MTFLKQALSLCPNVCCVLTKTDFYPAWRKILDLDTEHLAAQKLDLQILPVSSVAPAAGARDRRSGAQHRVRVPGTPRVAAHRDRRRRRAPRGAGRLLGDPRGRRPARIALPLRGEGPRRARESAAELQRDLDAGRAKSEKLKSQTARWAQTLNDGIGDLSSDVDHDLRGRFREIIREADEVIEEGDPAEFWEEFEPWLYRRTAEDVVYSTSVSSRARGGAQRARSRSTVRGRPGGARVPPRPHRGRQRAGSSQRHRVGRVQDHDQGPSG